ncbi:hypothetical protein E0E50_05835 [Azotobacter chroococcum subsp. isscasi]|uniref:hypothetical protein n=1 Tax=Azotobacter chroococcum TaxID=353 RepID=UPI00103C6270|nr:hypothetical protein [Azotobacter chroococcum]TBW11690.1 hypothetical protein E0E50_05835 [Azotobacter chroococcum subsp. isscasi]
MRGPICAAEMPVTLDGRTKPASQWAAERGLKWQTVKMRRYRGARWEEALRPELYARSWMEGWSFAC